MTLKTKLIPLIFAIVMVATVGTVSAQENTGNDNQQTNDIPGDVTTPESTVLSNELHETRENLFGIMTGFESTDDALNNAFDGIPITLLGIINDNTTLYIGIDDIEDEEFDKLLSDSKTFLPDVPYIIERVGIGQYTQASSNVIQKVVNANLAIPDNAKDQITVSNAQVTELGTLRDISVRVDITHTFVNDLRIDLVSPGGEIIPLRTNSGGSANDIAETYTVANTSALSSLIGDNIQGTWKLRVGDYGRIDIGTLNSWTLTITPNITPPPTNPTGGTSNAIFEDDFESGLGKWIESGEGDWRIGTQDRRIYLDPNDTDNLIAESDNCDTQCTLTLRTPINLSTQSHAYLHLDRILSSAIDDDEYLKVQVGTGNSYTTIFEWTHPNDDDNMWHHQVHDLSSYLTATNFSIRLVTTTSSSGEDVGIDNIEILTTASADAPLSCITMTNESKPYQGGDRVLLTDSEDPNDATIASCGTIGLGGITVGDQKGFVTASHLIPNGNTVYAGVHGLTFENNMFTAYYEPLGKVSINPGYSNNVRTSDTLFVEYPEICTFDILTICLRYSYVETVEPLRIEGDTTTYTVTGITTPRNNLGVSMSGVMNGEQSSRIEAIGMDFSGTVGVNGPTVTLRNAFIVDFPTNSIVGDSGGPIFTAPRSGNTNIVGTIVGTNTYQGSPATFGTPWADSQTAIGFDRIP